MPDMTETDQESYGSGYGHAEADIAAGGIKYADRHAQNLQKFTDEDRTNGPDWYSVGYITCVNAWKEGVRL